MAMVKLSSLVSGTIDFYHHIVVHGMQFEVYIVEEREGSLEFLYLQKKSIRVECSGVFM
jgi:hypothetical protein